MVVVVSACLLGRNCKYSGGNNYNAKVASFVEGKTVIEICPEISAGMPIPRPPVELVGGVAMDINGKNVDEQYRRGVECTLEQLHGKEVDCVILQSRSPTCGVKQIYDGSFRGTLIEGRGLLAEALIDNGYRVIDVEDLS